MPSPLILFYAPVSLPYVPKLMQLCAVQKIQLRKLTNAALDRSLASLVQGPSVPEEPSTPGEPLPEPILLFCHLSNAQLDRLLPALRRIQILCLKAVLTPANAQWTLRALYGELCKERSQLGGAHPAGP